MRVMTSYDDHRSFLWFAIFVLHLIPFLYVHLYMVGCNGNCTTIKQPTLPPPIPPEDQLRSLDSQYAESLNVVFWDHVYNEKSGSKLAKKFTEMMVDYQEKRSALLLSAVNDLTAENDVQGLLYLQQFIIDLANDPDSRNPTELKESLEKYEKQPAIRLKPSCLEPYPPATKLIRMYHKAIHFKLTNCVIEAHAPPLPPPPKASVEQYREKVGHKARVLTCIIFLLALFFFGFDALFYCCDIE